MAIQSLTTSSFMDPARNVYLKFGTPKVAISPWGDYVAWAQNRVIEGTVDLTQIVAGNSLIVSDVTFFPALASGQIMIEYVEAFVESACSAGGTVSLGLIDSDRATVPTNYDKSFINVSTAFTSAAVGTKLNFVAAGTPATANGPGLLLGSQAAVQTPVAPDLVNSYYITCSVATTQYTTGKVRFRIFYHALDAAITQ
jgi:hypothetical protein